MTKIPIPIRL